MKVFITKNCLGKEGIQEAEGELSQDVPGAFRGKIVSPNYDKVELFKAGEWFENLGDANVDANTRAIEKATKLEQQAAALRKRNFATTNMVG